VPQTLDAVLSVLKEPTSNLTAFALIAAAVTLVALILILTAILWLLAPLARAKASAQGETVADEETSADGVGTDSEQSGPGTEAPPPAKKRGAGPGAWLALIALFAAAGITAAYVTTASDQYCTEMCHLESVAAQITGPGVHDGMRCVACHEDPAPVGVLANAMSRIVHALPRGQDTPPGAATVMRAHRCLECHGDILDATISVQDVGVRMSHAEPIDAGMTCSDCHAISVHGSQPRPVSMSECLRCHDSQVASAECSTCHMGDPADSVRASRRMIVTEVKLPPMEDCGGCHDQESCDACHGLRLPHSRAFVEGEHAPQAAFDRKTLCWRCHAEEDCGACHNSWLTHGPDFDVEHQRYPRGATCDTCHHWHEGSFCARCHGPGW